LAKDDLAITAHRWAFTRSMERLVAAAPDSRLLTRFSAAP
jgi:hypothetical protein